MSHRLVPLLVLGIVSNGLYAPADDKYLSLATLDSVTVKAAEKGSAIQLTTGEAVTTGESFTLKAVRTEKKPAIQVICNESVPSEDSLTLKVVNTEKGTAIEVTTGDLVFVVPRISFKSDDKWLSQDIIVENGDLKISEYGSKGAIRLIRAKSMTFHRHAIKLTPDPISREARALKRSEKEGFRRGREYEKEKEEIRETP
jgi:hypothetical protein